MCRDAVLEDVMDGWDGEVLYSAGWAVVRPEVRQYQGAHILGLPPGGAGAGVREAISMGMNGAVAAAEGAWVSLRRMFDLPDAMFEEAEDADAGGGGQAEEDDDATAPEEPLEPPAEPSPGPADADDFDTADLAALLE